MQLLPPQHEAHSQEGSVESYWPFDKGAQIAVVQLTQWLDWVTRNQRDLFVALPMIQRGSVWSANKIVDLWDSLLRGMPIGSLTVSQFQTEKMAMVRRLGEKMANEELVPKGGLSLLDGQQRTLAMCVGWPPKGVEDRRVWVDFAETGLGGHPFRLRVTTQFQPFGYNQYDQSKKLSRWERRSAREQFDQLQENLVFKDLPDYRLPLSHTRPWGAKSPLELSGLIQKWREEAGNVENWCSKVIDLLGPDSVSDAIRDRVQAFANALQRLFAMQIALVRVAPELLEHSPADLDEGEEPDLVVLFRRIANSGAPLSRADYVFSLIKHRFPEAHNLVAHLHGEGHVASLLSADDLVMTAVRIATHTHTHSQGNRFPDIPMPSPKEFGRILRAKVDPDGGDFLKDALLPLIQEADPHSLHAAFREVHRLLAFRPEKCSADPGLPKLAFPLLQRQLVQVLVLWVHQRQHRAESESCLEKSRADILRFVLFWLLCVGDTEKEKEAAGKLIFEKLEDEPPLFPGRDLAAALCEKELALDIEHPDLMAKHLLSDLVNGKPIRGWTRRFWKQQEDESWIEMLPMHRRWFHRKSLLLWLQRQTLETRFQGADPLAGREEETPYDYDHICPHADWAVDGRSSHLPFRGYFDDNQATTIANSIGNYRVWESSDNRSLGDASPSVRLGLEAVESEETQLLLIESLIAIEEVEGWRRCSALPQLGGVWEEDRAFAFVKVVEARALRLYRQYVEESGLTAWLPSSGSQINDSDDVSQELQ